MRMEFTWHGCDSALAAPLVLDLARLTAAAHARRAGRARCAELAFFFKDPLGAAAAHSLARAVGRAARLRPASLHAAGRSSMTSVARPRRAGPGAGRALRARRRRRRAPRPPARSAARTAGPGRRLGLPLLGRHGRQRLGRPRPGRGGTPRAADPVRPGHARPPRSASPPGLTAAGLGLAAGRGRPPRRSPSPCRWPPPSGRTTWRPRTPRPVRP